MPIEPYLGVERVKRANRSKEASKSLLYLCHKRVDTCV